MLTMNIPPQDGELQSERYIDTKSGMALYSSQRTVATSEIAAREVSRIYLGLHILIRNRKQTDLFCTAMQFFADSHDGKASEVESGFDIRGAHSWDEVVEAVQHAEAVYKTHGSGIGGLHRKIFRVIGDYNDALEPWIKLIPTEDHYLSVLCGGLKLFLGVSISKQATGWFQ